MRNPPRNAAAWFSATGGAENGCDPAHQDIRNRDIQREGTQRTGRSEADAGTGTVTGQLADTLFQHMYIARITTNENAKANAASRCACAL